MNGSRYRDIPFFPRRDCFCSSFHLVKTDRELFNPDCLYSFRIVLMLSTHMLLSPFVRALGTKGHHIDCVTCPTSIFYGSKFKISNSALEIDRKLPMSSVRGLSAVKIFGNFFFALLPFSQNSCSKRFDGPRRQDRKQDRSASTTSLESSKIVR